MADTANTPNNAERQQTLALTFSVFVAGLCSIVYELLIATVSSYFLGNSVTKFSLTIGIYMAAMGLGAWISRHIQRDEYSFFVKMEIALGFLGGLSVPILFATYSFIPDSYIWVMVLLTAGIGVLIGFEIPMLTRLLERFYTLKMNISHVLSLDYFGALIATLLFPFVLLPWIGPFRSSLLFGIVNMSIGFLVLWKFPNAFNPGARKYYAFLSSSVLTLLVGLLIASQALISNWSDSLYDDTVILEKQTPYQRIVVTRYGEDVRLFLDGNLQFSSRDEFRYHEAIAHPALAQTRNRQDVLILGGGDGLLAREVLKWPDVEQIIMVDLDPAVTDLARAHPLFTQLNDDALKDPRIEVINGDAFQFLDTAEGREFQTIIADLPDPNNISLARLYSREFYRLVRSRLAPGGVFVTQATSPYFATETFWQIQETVSSAGFGDTLPYHADVPSFGDWGFIMAANHSLETELRGLPNELRFLSEEGFPVLTHFSKDLSRDNFAVLPNTLDNPTLLARYLKAVRDWR
ncbi:MAG: polyamine aminopropyltransferase [Opitutales bacterium]